MAKRTPDEPEIKLYAQLGLRLPAELAMRLKRFCGSSGKSLNAVTQEALSRYLDAEEKRRGR